MYIVQLREHEVHNIRHFEIILYVQIEFFFSCLYIPSLSCCTDIIINPFMYYCDNLYSLIFLFNIDIKYLIQSIG